MTPLPNVMKAVLLTGHGGPDMLKYRDDIPVPVPGAGDVVIAVLAAGMNNTDINTRLAWYSKGDGDAVDAGWSGGLDLPRIQGADVCGRVVAVGDGVNATLIGKRVLVEPCLQWDGDRKLDEPWYFGSECDGGFAQYTRVSARHVYAVESPLKDTELASFPCSWSTAENMLTRSGVTAGDRVLVTGASGGVGSAALQLAKLRGATVIAQTSPSKATFLQDLGADQVVGRDDNLVQVLGKDSVDVVIDLVGGPQWPALLDILRRRGRYAVSGAIGGADVPLDLRTVYLKDLSFFGCTVLAPEVFGNLVGHIETGKLRPLVAETWPLHQIREAQERFQQKSHIGNIVLTMDDLP